MAAPLPITLRALAAATSSAAGTAVDIEYLTPTSSRIPRSAAKLKLELVALVGDTTLDVAIETSSDGATWSLAHTARYDLVGTVAEIIVGKLQRFVRASWTVAGSAPSATFSLKGNARQIYCEPEHLTAIAVAAAALANIDPVRLLDACIFGSAEAEGYLASAFTPPLLGWDDDLIEKTALLSVAKVFNHRGRDVEGPDAGVFLSAKEARDWFDRVANGRLKPPGIIDSTPETFEGGSVVMSKPSRGW